MRSNVIKIHRGAGLDARPVENPVDPGFPDVEYIGDLLELKATKSWPRKDGTPLRLEHYTQEQRIWHIRRSMKGGRIHVLLQVDREFLLFRASLAATLLGYAPESELRTQAVAVFSSLSDLRTALPLALQEAK